MPGTDCNTENSSTMEGERSEYFTAFVPTVGAAIASVGSNLSVRKKTIHGFRNRPLRWIHANLTLPLQKKNKNLFQN